MVVLTSYFVCRNGNGNCPTIYLYLLRGPLSMLKSITLPSISMLMMQQRLENDSIAIPKQ